MTTHHRRTIREAVVALLAAGSTSAGARVYDEPYDPRQAFPALSVWDVTEQQQAPTRPADSGRPIERTLLLEVRAEVQQAGTQHARIRDDLLADVERLLATTPIAGVKSVKPAGYAPQRDMSGDLPVNVGRQRFEFLYYTTQGDPSTAL